MNLFLIAFLTTTLFVLFAEFALSCEKHCTDYTTKQKECDDVAGKVILRKSDCAFMKKNDTKFKFVVGMEGQTEDHQTTTESEATHGDAILCCKPSKETATNFIVGVANKRLMLAKDVVAYKHKNNQSIDDFEREKVVLDTVLKQAKDAEIDQNFGQQFFQDQMDANKIIQKGYKKEWDSNKSTPPPAEEVPDLATATRPKVQEATTDMVLALAVFQLFRNDCSEDRLHCWHSLEEKQKMTDRYLSLKEPNGADAYRKAVVRLCAYVPDEEVKKIDEKATKLLA